MCMVAFNTCINQESIAQKSSTMTDHLQVQQHQQLELPSGFRFHPTDKEIINSYLIPKVLEESFVTAAIEEVDLNKYEPWELPGKAKMGEKEWYFYSQKDRKFPTGIRTNRATPSGYWKSTGKDKEIFHPRSMLIDMKKTLVFYKGRAPKGEKTNWFVHEYRLGSGKQTTLDLPTVATINTNSKEEWVVCRIFHKSIGLKKVAKSPYVIPMSMGADHQQGFIDLSILSPLMDYKVSQSLAPPSSLTLASSYQVDTIGAGSPMMGSATLPMINDYYIGNHHHQMMAPWPPLMSLYQQKHEMMMQMQMGGEQSFMVEARPRSGPSSTVPQQDAITRMSTNDPRNIAAAAVSEISSVNMGMDYMWKY